MGFLIVILVPAILDRRYSLKTTVDRYKDAEKKPTNLISRAWMVYAMDIAKQKNFAPASVSRLYAYVASVYADVFEQTKSETQASNAVSTILNQLEPSFTQRTDQFLTSLGLVKEPLSKATQLIVSLHQARTLADGYDFVWDKKTPADGWYIRNNQVDGGAKAGDWQPWILSKEDQIVIPPPPAPESLADQLEKEKIQFTTSRVKPSDLSIIHFWHSSSGFVKGVNHDNITPAGIWQNILFVEEGERLSDREYAQAQKILAQAIADAFIATWRIKYTYYSKRPSMILPNLAVVVADPPFPGYVSGHSTISQTAAVVLSAFFPEKRDVWMQNSQDARNSRLLAGIHFDVDNQMGKYLGERVAENILATLYPDRKTTIRIIDEMPMVSPFFGQVERSLYRFANAVEREKLALRRFLYTRELNAKRNRLRSNQLILDKVFYPWYCEYTSNDYDHFARA